MKNTVTLTRDAVLELENPPFPFPCDDIRRYIGAERGFLRSNPDPMCRQLGLPGEHVLRESLTRALAETLWHHRGGHDVANWLEAERLVDSLLDARSRKKRNSRSRTTTLKARNEDARTQ